MKIERCDWNRIIQDEANAPFFDAIIENKKPVKIEKLVALIVRSEFEQNALLAHSAQTRQQVRDEAFREAGNIASGYSEAAADAIYNLKGK